MMECENVVLTRSILPSEKYANKKLSCDVIGFSDGSNTAYACVIYLRWKNHDESIIDVKFLGAKAKVSAIKGNTTPWNELCGALILTRLCWSALKSMKKSELYVHLAQSNPRLYTDSTTVLSWIRSTPIKFKPYVKNKVIEIQTMLPSSIWKYVPSKTNKAADMLSKGCTRTDLDVIIEGPDILKTPYDQWPAPPNNETVMTVTELVVERNVTVVTMMNPLLNLEKFN